MKNPLLNRLVGLLFLVCVVLCAFVIAIPSLFIWVISGFNNYFKFIDWASSYYIKKFEKPT
jgi:hypothetical protein